MPDTIGDLARLEQEERAVSQRRRRLHERIEFIRGSGVHDSESAERLAKLEVEETEASRHRRELHGRIKALRGQASAGVPAPVAPKEALLERPSRASVAATQIGFGSLAKDDTKLS